MKIVDVRKTQPMPNPHKIKAVRLYDSDHAQCIHLTLDAGESLIAHITPVDVFFYVLEGNPTISIGEEKQSVCADNLVESPANIPHCIYNETDAPARILVVKVPKPTAPTKYV